LEYLQLYGTTEIKNKEVQLDNFITTLISAHGSRLKRLSLHRLPISLEALDCACAGFVNLEQLFIVVEQQDLVSLLRQVSITGYIDKFQEFIGNSLSKATKLQAAHINLTSLPMGDTDFPYAEDVLRIVNRCSSTVTQIGCASRVWQVSRVLIDHCVES